MRGHQGLALLTTPDHPIVLAEGLIQIRQRQTRDHPLALPEGITVLLMTPDRLLHLAEDRILQTIAIADHPLVVAIEVQDLQVEVAEVVILQVHQDLQVPATRHHVQVVAVAEEVAAVLLDHLHDQEEADVNKNYIKVIYGQGKYVT